MREDSTRKDSTFVSFFILGALRICDARKHFIEEILKILDGFLLLTLKQPADRSSWLNWSLTEKPQTRIHRASPDNVSLDALT